MIDWEQPANNDFLRVSQFSVTGALYTCRPDLVGFVNGLPLVVIELKKPGVPTRAALFVPSLSVPVWLFLRGEGNVEDERPVIPWTCLSVEPALYLPTFGVRTEVNVFVEDRGARVTGEIQTEFARLC